MRAVRHVHLMQAAGVVPARTDAEAVPARTARQRRPQAVAAGSVREDRREAALERRREGLHQSFVGWS